MIDSAHLTSQEDRVDKMSLHPFSFRHLISVLTVVVGTMALSPAAAAGGLLSMTMGFSPQTVGVGGTSRLTYTISNAGPAVQNIAFQNNLPTGMSVAVVPGTTTTCIQARVSAAAGATVIRVDDARLIAQGTCTVSVNVVATATANSTTSALESSGGPGSPAFATLTVDESMVRLAASFTPSTIPFGADSALTIVFDNTANPAAVFQFSVDGILPDGLVVSSLQPLSSDCGTDVIPPTLTAAAGQANFRLFANGFGGFPALGAEATCSVTIPVEPTRAGTFELVTGEAVMAGVSVGFATAILNAEARAFTRVFSPRRVAPGAAVQATYLLSNFNRNVAATEIAFSDDVGSALAGAVISDVALGADCGATATATGLGTGVLGFAGGAIAPEANCTFVATFDVPSAAPNGPVVVTSSPVTYQASGQPRLWDAASDILTVAAVPTLTKSNSGPVGAGGEITLTYVVTNPSTEAIDTITFDDPLPVVIPGVAAVFPAAGFCGGASTVAAVAIDVDVVVYRVAGADLAPQSSCTFDVVVTLPSNAGEPGGIDVTSSLITATLPDDTVVVGAPATDTLNIVTGPRLSKEFSGSSTAGGLVDLTYTLAADPLESADATLISFTDVFDSIVPGLLIESATLADVCGSGSALTVNPEQTEVYLTDGVLAPGETCSFTLTLSVPAAAPPGVFPSTTSAPSSAMAGVEVTSPSATANLIIDGVRFSMEVVGSPVFPGADAIVSVTFENATNEAASNGFFTINLADVFPGLTAVSLPPTPCGAGSSLSGTTFVIGAGLSLSAFDSCSFDIPVSVPVSAPIGQYSIQSSGNFTLATSGAAQLPITSAPFAVADPLVLSAEFVSGTTTAPGGNATLSITIGNAGADASNGALTLDLDAALRGLVATGLPIADICGVGSSLTGTGNLTFSAPTLTGASTCTFDIPLVIPADAAAGTYTVVTSNLTAQTGGVGVQAPSVSAGLNVFQTTLLAAFDGPTVAGGTAVLTFTLESSSPSSDLDLSVDLDTFVSGATAVGLPLDDVCGPQSALDGTSTILLRSASLNGADLCAFSVTIQIPDGTPPAAYPLDYGPLTQGGLRVADAQVPAVLRVEPPPQLDLSVSPTLVSEQAPMTMTLTIDNTSSVLSASDITVAFDLPTNIFVAAESTPASTCDGGTLTAVAESETNSLTGAGVAAASTCTVTFDIAGTTGDYAIAPVSLTSSNGASESDEATFAIEGALSVTLASVASALFVDGTTTVTATLENPSADREATGIAFDVAIDGQLAAAEPLNAVTDCGGALVSESGALAFSGGTLAAGATCAVSWDVVAAAVDGEASVGVESGTSTLGPIADASIGIGVEELPSFAAAFEPTAIALNAQSELSFTIIGAATLDATGLEFSTSIPAGLDIESAASVSAACVGGAVAQVGQTLTFTADRVAASTICVVSTFVQPSEVGVFDIETSALTMDEGDAPSTTASLTVTLDGPEPDPEPGAEPGVEPGSEPGAEPGSAPEGTPEADPPADGCGCSASPSNTKTSPWGVLALVLGIAALRRRRRP